MAATSLPSLPLRRLLPPSSAATSSSSPILTFDSLSAHLSASDFRQADHETRRLLLHLAGDSAQKRGYVFFSEVQFIAPADLTAIDDLWRRHSGGRFGYSVQRRLWDRSLRDFTRLFVDIGWMRRMETEVVQFTYRSFPEDFFWELDERTPEGHLPLTNALRGTQLLGTILMHPAFEKEADGGDEEGEKGRVMKPDYSF